MYKWILKFDSKELASIFFVIALYIIQLVGIGFYDSSLFASLSPLIILFSIVLFLLNIKFDRPKILYLLVVYTIVFIIEVLSIRTGILFGWYKFGEKLGYTIFEVPLLIGGIWAVSIYSAGSLTQLMFSNLWVKSIWGAVFMLILNVFIERGALTLNLWTRTVVNHVPAQNYLTWFVLSFFALMATGKLNLKSDNRFPAILFVSQLLFFIGLSVFR